MWKPIKLLGPERVILFVLLVRAAIDGAAGSTKQPHAYTRYLDPT